MAASFKIDAPGQRSFPENQVRRAETFLQQLIRGNPGRPWRGGCLEGPTEMPAGQPGAETQIRLGRPSEVPWASVPRTCYFCAIPGGWLQEASRGQLPCMRSHSVDRRVGGRACRRSGLSGGAFPAAESRHRSPENEAPLPVISAASRAHEAFAQKHLLAPLISQTHNNRGTFGGTEARKEPRRQRGARDLRLQTSSGVHPPLGAQNAGQRTKWSASPVKRRLVNPRRGEGELGLEVR